MSTSWPASTGIGSATKSSSTGAGRPAESLTVMVKVCSSGPLAPCMTLPSCTNWVFTSKVPVFVGAPFRKMCLMLPKLRCVAVMPAGRVDSSIVSPDFPGALFTRMSIVLICFPVQNTLSLWSTYTGSGCKLIEASTNLVDLSWKVNSTLIVSVSGSSAFESGVIEISPVVESIFAPQPGFTPSARAYLVGG